MKRTLSGEIVRIEESSDESNSQQCTDNEEIVYPKELLEETGIESIIQNQNEMNDIDKSEDSDNTSDSSEMEEENLDNNTFIPSDFDKQVIRLSLGMIRNSNMFDWDLANSYDTCMMILKDMKVICIDQECFDCEIVNKVEYDEDYTSCAIACTNKKTSKMHNIYLVWYTNDKNSNILNISKDFYESSYLLFKRKIRKECIIETEDCPTLSWCYFPDARIHLNRIRPE